MAEVAGTGPLLLGLQLANQNNNNNGTVIVRPRVAEATYLKNRKEPRNREEAGLEPLEAINGEIPGGMIDMKQQSKTAGCLNELRPAYHHSDTQNSRTTPLVRSPVMGRNSNDKCGNAGGASAGTFIAPKQITELDFQRRKLDQQYESKSLSPSDAELKSTRCRSVQATQTHVPALTEAQIKVFKSDGYLLIPDALTASESGALLDEAQEVIRTVTKGEDGITEYDGSDESTIQQLSPVGSVLATFEPVIPTSLHPYARRVARLGCGVHELMLSFNILTHNPFHRSIATSLGCGTNPRITQSQVIVKSAGQGSAIVPHQDGWVSFTDPPSCLTYWYPLEDCTIENGCLEVARGSHLTEPIRQRMVKGGKGQSEIVDLERPIWPKGAREGEKQEYDFEPLEVAKGTLVLFHGNLLHRSGRNRSGKGRMAYTFSVVDGDAYMPENSLMKPDEGELDCL